MSGSANELSRQRNGVAEIEEQRLFGLDHPAEQPRLDLVLHGPDGKRSDADGAAPFERYAVVLRPQPFDARRRHGVDIGGDFHAGGPRQLWRTYDLHAGAPGRQDDVDALDRLLLQRLAAAVGMGELDLEALLGEFRQR